MENQEQAPVEGQQTAAPQNPELTVTDLINLRAIIDVAVRRGAFNASELSGVGAAFDRLNAFVNAVAPQKTEAPQPAENA